jgi:hypothetical protein
VVSLSKQTQRLLINPTLLFVAVSFAPVYGPYDTFIGTGRVGGRMPSFEGMGRQAGNTVRAILAGAADGAVFFVELPTGLAGAQ